MFCKKGEQEDAISGSPVYARTMKHMILSIWGLAFACKAHASDRIFRDIEAQSSNGEWRLDARSPDNKIDAYQRWQNDFVYTMRKGGRFIISALLNIQSRLEFKESGGIRKLGLIP